MYKRGLCLRRFNAHVAAGQVALWAAQAYGKQCAAPGRLKGGCDVGGVAAGSDGQQQVARSPQGFYLTRKYLAEVQVAANGRERCGIGRQRQGGQGWPVHGKPVHKFGSQVLGKCGACAVAAEQQLAASRKAGRRPQRDVAQIVALRQKKFLAQACAIVGVTFNNFKSCIVHAAHKCRCVTWKPIYLCQSPATDKRPQACGNSLDNVTCRGMQNATNRHILLVYKARHDRAAALADEAAQWLRQKGHTVTDVICAGVDSPAYAVEPIDFVVVLGGDGTMLGVARRLVGRKVPVLGINFGRIGFLTDAQPEQWREKLEECLSGSEPARSCMALSWSLTRKGQQIARGCAVNDVVLSRGSLSRLVLFDVFIAGERLGSLRGDGIIVATPVGSSGYSVSAGGSLLHPSMEAIAITPICPFLNSISPMVFPGNTECTFQILQGSTDCFLTVDGQEGQQLELGDTVTVAGLPGAVHFLGKGTTFFERLRSRGFVLQGAECSKRGDNA